MKIYEGQKVVSSVEIFIVQISISIFEIRLHFVPARVLWKCVHGTAVHRYIHSDELINALSNIYKTFQEWRSRRGVATSQALNAISTKDATQAAGSTALLRWESVPVTRSRHIRPHPIRNIEHTAIRKPLCDSLLSKRNPFLYLKDVEMCFSPRPLRSRQRSSFLYFFHFEIRISISILHQDRTLFRVNEEYHNF